MGGFIDIHNHSLFAVDDGAEDLKESLFLLDELKALGFSHVVCTPHQATVHFNPPWEAVERNFAILRQEAGSIELSLGAENFYDDQFVRRVEEGKVPTLGEGIGVLVEFSPSFPPASFREVIFLIQVNGFVPVVAHIERYPWLSRQDLEFVRDSGGFLQINLTSLVEGVASTERIERARHYLSKGLVDVLATDTHATRWTVAARGALSWLEAHFGPRTIEELLIEGPSEILALR